MLAQLPDDMWVETVEVAPSDPKRIYVSGTSSADLLEGVVLRSDDGGIQWTRSTVRLPRGSGSLFISGIHPTVAPRPGINTPLWLLPMLLLAGWLRRRPTHEEGSAHCRSRPWKVRR